MIRKLINLAKHYDEIMELVNNKPAKTKKSTKSKVYSTLNTPQGQLDYIANIMKGEKK